MPSPSSFAIFAVVNAVVWPGFALAYWYNYQRKEEKLMDAVNDGPTDESKGEEAKIDERDAQAKSSGTGGKY